MLSENPDVIAYEDPRTKETSDTKRTLKDGPEVKSGMTEIDGAEVGSPEARPNDDVLRKKGEERANFANDIAMSNQNKEQKNWNKNPPPEVLKDELELLFPGTSSESEKGQIKSVEGSSSETHSA